jgi:hypothetical protein
MQMAGVLFFICFAMLLFVVEQQTTGIFGMSLLGLCFIGIIVLGNQYFSKCIGDCI